MNGELKGTLLESERPWYYKAPSRRLSEGTHDNNDEPEGRCSSFPDFYPEDGISIFLQNIGCHVPDCTVS